MGHQRIRPSAPGVAEALLWDLVHVAIDGVSVFMRLVDERRGHDLPDAVADTLIAAAPDIVSALND